MICLIALVPIWQPRADLYRHSIMLGLALSLVGDVFMSLRSGFIGGLSSFLLAHVCYVIAFTSGAVPLRPLRILPFLLFGCVIIPILYPGIGDLKIPVFIYMAVILTMGWRAAARLGKPGERREAHLAALLGAISFIISDSLIALGKFHGEIPAGHPWVMITYWAGQFGIAWSVKRT